MSEPTIKAACQEAVATAYGESSQANRSMQNEQRRSAPAGEAANRIINPCKSNAAPGQKTGLTRQTKSLFAFVSDLAANSAATVTV